MYLNCHPEQGRGVWFQMRGAFLSLPDVSAACCRAHDKTVSCTPENQVNVPNKKHAPYRVSRIKHRAFTLIELLVVIPVIVLLMALLLPALQRARNHARAAVCQAHLKQWGTTLSLYTEDNQGCFPCYGHDEDIIWFLRGSIPSSNGPNEELLRPIEVRGIACCPMAVRRGRSRHFFIGYDNGLRVEGWSGKTFDAWEMIGPGRPFRTSYGFNGWLFCCDFDASIPVRTRWFGEMSGVRIDTLRGRGNIPVLLDSIEPYGHPDGRRPPPIVECLLDPGMGRFAIKRHNEHINSLFLDWSVRRVGIKELWTLKWHMQFDTSNVWTKAGGVKPEDWPQWMRGFKDY